MGHKKQKQNGSQETKAKWVTRNAKWVTRNKTKMGHKKQKQKSKKVKVENGWEYTAEEKGWTGEKDKRVTKFK